MPSPPPNVRSRSRIRRERSGTPGPEPAELARSRGPVDSEVGGRRDRAGRRRGPVDRGAGHRSRCRGVARLRRRTRDRSWGGARRRARRTSSDRRAAAVRARIVAVPRVRPAGRRTGPDPAAGDRGGRGGRHRSGRGARRPSGCAGSLVGRSYRVRGGGSRYRQSARSRSRSRPRCPTPRSGRPTSARDALAVARANLAGAGLPATRIRLAEGSWFDALPAELRGDAQARRVEPAVHRRGRGRDARRHRRGLGTTGRRW